MATLRGVKDTLCKNCLLKGFAFIGGGRQPPNPLPPVLEIVIFRAKYLGIRPKAVRRKRPQKESTFVLNIKLLSQNSSLRLCAMTSHDALTKRS